MATVIGAVGPEIWGAGAPEHGGEEPDGDCAVQAGHRPHARSDAKRHRDWQGDDRCRQPTEQVSPEGRQVVLHGEHGLLVGWIFMPLCLLARVARRLSVPGRPHVTFRRR